MISPVVSSTIQIAAIGEQVVQTQHALGLSTQAPGFLSIRPGERIGVVVDALSHMMQTLQMRTALYGSVRLQPPWGVGIPRVNAAAFRAVISGQCWLRLYDEGTWFKLAPSDAHLRRHHPGATAAGVIGPARQRSSTDSRAVRPLVVR
jgi:hypothetical protein